MLSPCTDTIETQDEQSLIDALGLIGLWPDLGYVRPRAELLDELHTYAPRLTDQQLQAIDWIVLTFLCHDDVH